MTTDGTVIGRDRNFDDDPRRRQIERELDRLVTSLRGGSDPRVGDALDRIRVLMRDLRDRMTDNRNNGLGEIEALGDVLFDTQEAYLEALRLQREDRADERYDRELERRETGRAFHDALERFTNVLGAAYTNQASERAAWGQLYGDNLDASEQRGELLVSLVRDLAIRATSNAPPVTVPSTIIPPVTTPIAVTPPLVTPPVAVTPPIMTPITVTPPAATTTPPLVTPPAATPSTPVPPGITSMATGVPTTITPPVTSATPTTARQALLNLARRRRQRIAGHYDPTRTTTAMVTNPEPRQVVLYMLNKPAGLADVYSQAFDVLEVEYDFSKAEGLFAQGISDGVALPAEMRLAYARSLLEQGDVETANRQLYSAWQTGSAPLRAKIIQEVDYFATNRNLGARFDRELLRAMNRDSREDYDKVLTCLWLGESYNRTGDRDNALFWLDENRPKVNIHDDIERRISNALANLS